jgi:hypothetical protein
MHAPGSRPPNAARASRWKPKLPSSRQVRTDPEIPIWALQSSPPDPLLRFGKGDELEITIQNSLPVRTVLNWHGLDGLTAAEPLITRSPLPPAGKETLAIPLRQAGTFLCDLRLLADGQTRPMAVLPPVSIPRMLRCFTPSTVSSRLMAQHAPVNGCGFASLAAVNAL